MIQFITDPLLRRAERGQFTLGEHMAAIVDGAAHIVPQGFTTDGASIPAVCWLLVGHPYSPSSLRAAILHDWMCRDHTHGLTSARVHRVFYDALRAEGVAWARARLMYAAVALFGPTWTTLPKVSA